MQPKPAAASLRRETDDAALVHLNTHLAAIRTAEDELRDDVDAELLPVFLEEADELCPRIGHCLRALHNEPNHDPQLLNRLLHTLKGSARMTGVMRIGNIAHTMEGRLLANGTEADLRNALEIDFARINSLLEELRRLTAKENINPAAGLDRSAIPVGEERGTLAQVSERLYRTVRQTAKQLNKRVNLELIWNGVVLDRSVLKKMTAPLEHLLRNAIVHGIEDEPLRIASGKEIIGEITLSLRRENNEAIFELGDDGRGLNLAALRAQAIEKGLPVDADTSASCDQLAQLIFIPGISTAGEVTQVAGRGIGMDVVRSEITELGGQINVSSIPGQGTRFTIHLPDHSE
ncbi:MAG: ATP-binding protein [Gallionella sp.]|jgi:chemosensory pili system protein ChpA (sensor histidine kinase/response regulator)